MLKKRKKLTPEAEDRIVLLLAQNLPYESIIQNLKATYGIDVTPRMISYVKKKWFERHVDLVAKALSEEEKREMLILKKKELIEKKSIQDVCLMTAEMAKKIVSRLKKKLEETGQLDWRELNWLLRVREILSRDRKLGIELSVTEKSIYDQLHDKYLGQIEKTVKKKV